MVEKHYHIDEILNIYLIPQKIIDSEYDLSLENYNYIENELLRNEIIRLQEILKPIGNDLQMIKKELLIPIDKLLFDGDIHDINLGLHDVFGIIDMEELPLLHKIYYYVMSLIPSSARVESLFSILSNIFHINTSLNTLDLKTKFAIFNLNYERDSKITIK